MRINVRVMNCWRARASWLTGAVVLLLSAVEPASAQIPCRYDVTFIPDVDCGLFSGPMGPIAINSSGVVLGSV